MKPRLAALRSVVTDATLRRLEAAFAGFSIAEHATWISTLVYAFERGGVRQAGIVAFALLLAAMLVAPLLSYAGDRFRRDRVLAVGYAAQATAMAATAIAMHAGLNPVLVYVQAGLAATAVTVIRPAMGALLPFVADTPGDLVAANVAMGLLENGGIFLGPLIAAALLAFGSPALVFLVMAATVAVSAVLVVRMAGDRERLRPPEGSHSSAVWGEVLGGFRAMREQPDIAVLIGCLSFGAVSAGAIEVLFVALAGQFSAGRAEAGLLNSAFGAGAIAGAGASVVLVGRARMTPFLVLGTVMLSAPLVVLAAYTNRMSAIVLLAISGVGLSVLKIAGTSLLQRVARAATAGRVFGVLEALQMGMMAVGSFAVSALASAFGLRVALVTAGLAVPSLSALLVRRLFVMDRHGVPADPVIVNRLRKDPIFAPLSAPSLERLALATVRLEIPRGGLVIREGDAGDTFYLVLSGAVDILIRGDHVRIVTTGGSFGEIALLRDIGRTATAVAAERSELLVLGRAPFLEALNEHHRARTTAEDVVDQSLLRT